MDCTDIVDSYNKFTESICGDLNEGMKEVLLLGIIVVPLEIALLFLGMTFVLRNKVDVPKYEIHKDMKKPKKPKKGKKKSGADGNAEEGDPNVHYSALDIDLAASQVPVMPEDESDSDEEEELPGCCGCRKKKKPTSGKDKKLSEVQGNRFGQSSNSMGQSFANDKLLTGLEHRGSLGNNLFMQQSEGEKGKIPRPGGSEGLNTVSINRSSEFR